MAVSSGTVGSGSKIKYVSWGAADAIKDIFDAVASIMTTSGGWTLASGTSGSFYTTYYSSATTDFRRVYSSPLLNTGSGLTTKYVMLRIAAASGTSNFKIQLIPFGSWNSGTDVGTNQAGIPLVNAQTTTYGNDADFLYVINNGVNNNAPMTIFNNSVAGLLYVAFDTSAAYLMMWPYYVLSASVYNGQRNQVLMYGEIQEDFTAYTNVPPVYVTTLQRLCAMSGGIPSNPNDGFGTNNYWGANNSNIGSMANMTYNWYPQPNGGAMYVRHYAPGPLWLSPVAPGSTTGYSGVSNTTRTGVQASAFQRMHLGHLGEWGWMGGWVPGSDQQIHISWGPSLIQGTYINTAASLGSSHAKYFLLAAGDTVNATTTTNSWGITALNSANLKGIEPVFGGGHLGSYNGSDSAYDTAYKANPFPMLWALGRVRGLKFVGAPSSGTWSTLDTVSMTVDANGFYVKTGGTATTFALVGFAPFPDVMTTAPGGDPTMFFAIPA